MRTATVSDIPSIESLVKESARRPVLLRLAALAAAIAMLVHASALAVPSVNLFLYSATYPWWRHIVFITPNPISLEIPIAPAKLACSGPIWSGA